MFADESNSSEARLAHEPRPPLQDRDYTRDMVYNGKKNGEYKRSHVDWVPQAPRRPLIEFCTNEWHHPQHGSQVGPRNIDDRFEDCLFIFFDRCLALLHSRKFRRLFFGVIFFLVFSVVIWITKLGPYVAETQALAASLKNVAAEGLFGSNIRPQFPGMTHIRTLDPELLPRGSTSTYTSPRNKRRLIFIGDIHGCKKELLALLDSVKFNPQNDHLIIVGDMIAKGPDSLGVVDVLRKHGASCVRGNHEDRILLLAAQINSSLRLNGNNSLEHDLLEEQSFSRNDAKDRKLARSLSSSQIDYLKSCPVILRVGEIDSFGGQIVVVHAGLVPGLPLERQDPTLAMTMRVVDLSTHVPSRDHSRKGSVAWTKLWNRYQELLPTQRTAVPLEDAERQKLKEIHTTVIYGHDSRRGLQIKKYTKGLDSGCVTGGKLTALVLTDGGKQNILQVRCRDFRDDKDTSP